MENLNPFIKTNPSDQQQNIEKKTTLQCHERLKKKLHNTLNSLNAIHHHLRRQHFPDSTNHEKRLMNRWRRVQIWGNNQITIEPYQYTKVIFFPLFFLIPHNIIIHFSPDFWCVILSYTSPCPNLLHIKNNLLRHFSFRVSNCIPKLLSHCSKVLQKLWCWQLWSFKCNHSSYITCSHFFSPEPLSTQKKLMKVNHKRNITSSQV